MDDKRQSAMMLMKDIEKACIKRGLNLTIYDGKIGFVDQQAGKIIMLWNPEYRLGQRSNKKSSTDFTKC